MSFVRVALAVLLLSCPSWADVFDYQYTVSVNTSFLGSSYGSVLFSLLDTDADTTTQVTVSNVSGFEQSGFLPPLKYGDVSGTLPGDVTFKDGSFFNTYLEVGAKFGNPFAFDLDFQIAPGVPSDDVFLFGLGNLSGARIELFTFSRGTLTVLQHEFVKVANRVSVPEPSSLAVLLLSLVLIGGAAVSQRRQHYA